LFFGRVTNFAGAAFDFCFGYFCHDNYLFSFDYADKERNHRHDEKQVDKEPGDLKYKKAGDPGRERDNAYD